MSKYSEFPRPSCCRHDGPVNPERLCDKCRRALHESHVANSDAADEILFTKDSTMNSHSEFDFEQIPQGHLLPLPSDLTSLIANGEEVPLGRTQWIEEERPPIERFGLQNALPLPGHPYGDGQ